MRAFLFSRKWKICCRIIPHLGGLKNVPRRTVRQQIVSIKNFRRQIFLCKIYKPKSKRKIPKNIQNGAHIFPISDKNADFFRYVLANIVCRIAADFWGKIKRRRLDNQRLFFDWNKAEIFASEFIFQRLFCSRRLEAQNQRALKTPSYIRRNL